MNNGRENLKVHRDSRKAEKDRAIALELALANLTRFIHLYTGDEKFSGEMTLRWRDGLPQKDDMMITRKIRAGVPTPGMPELPAPPEPWPPPPEVESGDG